MKVWVENNKAVVRCQYEEKEIVKAIGDYRFNKPTKTWVFPVRKLISIIDKLHIEYSPETYAIYERLVDERRAFHSKINLAEKIKKKEIPLAERLACGNNLYEHQARAVMLGSLFDSYAFFMETGTGKTLVAIRLIEHWNCKTLVIAPLSTLEKVWEQEFKKWSELRVVNLWNNLKAVNDDYDVYVINYEQFKKLHKDKNVAIEERFSAIIIDESSKLKNNKSQITKTVLEYKEKIKHRVCLTGTPAPNNLMEYWGQMAFINSELLSDNFYKFRNIYFFSTGYDGLMYKPMAGAKEAIMDKVSQQAFSIRKEDCLDLPERVFEERIIYMDPPQARAYEEMFKDNVMQFKEHTTIGTNELAKLMKLRQVTAGFTITTQDMPVLISNTKITALKELLEEIPEEKQVIIWCQFHWEIERLKKEFGDTAVTLYGALPQREKNENIQTFLDGKARLLIGHPKSGGMGLNFQKNSNFMIWFSLSYSQEEFSQACDRIYRSGQVNKCTYFILLARKKGIEGTKGRTIDEIIYKVVLRKASLMNACMELLKG